MKQILIPFVAGVARPDNQETRARLQRMFDYIKANNLVPDDFLILLSGGGDNKTLACSLYEIIKKMGGNFPDDIFIYEEESWDTTTQIKFMAPLIRKIQGKITIVVFSNRLHLSRIDLIFARFGFKIKKEPSPIYFGSTFFRIYYTIIYEPLMFIATIFYLDNLISYFTRRRLTRFNR